MNDHRRIAWRLSGRIAGEQIAAFLALDVFLFLLIVLSMLNVDAIRQTGLLNGRAADWVEALQGIPWLTLGSFWALVSIAAVQIVLLLIQTARVRKDIHELLEPLRELRVAADAFAGAAADAKGAAKGTAAEPGGQPMTRAVKGRQGGTDVSAEALRRMAEALHHVEAGDMNAHITAESVSPELQPLLEAITDMLDRLEAAYAAQATFVSDASHELRTPIAVIQGYANLLSRWGSEDPETLRESIEAIRTEADLMKQMVNQLLFLARGDSDTLRIDFQRVDIVSIADGVLHEELMIEDGMCGPEEEGKALRHQIEARLPEEPVYVSADPALIKQLIRILADNSVKYTAPGGNIRLSVKSEPENGRALIMVQDEGQGISAEFLPRVFDRFVRADEARTRNTGGSGLGLSIAKQIAERHGGSIEVFSVEGVGSRFTVILPLLMVQ